MPTNESNGLSLEVLLAAARGGQQEEEAQASEAAAPAAATPAPSAAGATGAAGKAPAARPAGVAASDTESGEPTVEPSAAVQEEAVEEAAASAEAEEPKFDLFAALGYGAGAQVSEPEPEEPKFDLAAALGYKSTSDREREEAEAASAEAENRARVVQERALREAEQQARLQERQEQREAARAEAVAERQEQLRQMSEVPAEREMSPEAAERLLERQEMLRRMTEEPEPRELSPEAKARKAEREEMLKRASGEAEEPKRKSKHAQRMAERRAERQRSIRPSSGLGAQSLADAQASEIESYQPTKRDRSATARAARPLKQEEVTEVAQAIAAENARIEYADEPAAEPSAAAQVKAAEAAEEAAEPEKKDTAPIVEERFTKGEEKGAAALAEPAAAAEEPEIAPAPEVEAPAEPAEPVQPVEQPKPVDFMAPEFAAGIAAGAPEAQQPQQRTKAPAGKPVVMPHKVPVRTTEEIIKPVGAPVTLGVIPPEAARAEAEAKKKVQTKERKIVKKVRRYRALGMFLIVVALAALAGAVFLFVAGNAQASESIESTAAQISEDSGRTITYRYKAADSNGTLCPTTEVATFSAGDVLEQSVITMNTPDFETAAHTLAAFKKQFQDTAYVDGRVDGSTVIFTLHMSNERIMKVTYTALLMTNTTGCEVAI